MLVQCTLMAPAEAQVFETVIRASGRDPRGFRAQVFEAANDPMPWRKVHVATPQASAQYEASEGTAWTESFARHLARGFFG